MDVLIKWFMWLFGMSVKEATKSAAKHMSKHAVKSHSRHVAGKVIEVAKYVRGG